MLCALRGFDLLSLGLFGHRVIVEELLAEERTTWFAWRYGLTVGVTGRVENTAHPGDERVTAMLPLLGLFWVKRNEIFLSALAKARRHLLASGRINILVWVEAHHDDGPILAQVVYKDAFAFALLVAAVQMMRKLVHFDDENAVANDHLGVGTLAHTHRKGTIKRPAVVWKGALENETHLVLLGLVVLACGLCEVGVWIRGTEAFDTVIPILALAVVLDAEIIGARLWIASRKREANAPMPAAVLNALDRATHFKAGLLCTKSTIVADVSAARCPSEAAVAVATLGDDARCVVVLLVLLRIRRIGLDGGVVGVVGRALDAVLFHQRQKLGLALLLALGHHVVAFGAGWAAAIPHRHRSALTLEPRIFNAPGRILLLHALTRLEADAASAQRPC